MNLTSHSYSDESDENTASVHKNNTSNHLINSSHQQLQRSATLPANSLINGSSISAGHDSMLNQSLGMSSTHTLRREQELRFSSVRRMFCLLVVFDLLVIFLLWILFTSVSGKDLFKQLDCQVNYYSWKTSLFDMVLISAGRVTCLLLAYALCKSKHWLTVAFTTLVTSVFVIVKIFYFDWSGTKYPQDLHDCNVEGQQHPLDYVIFLCVFAISWTETFILDMKVLPREKKLQEDVETGRADETRSLLGGGDATGYHPSYGTKQPYVSDNASFYSPVSSLDSSTESEDEARSARPYKTRTRNRPRHFSAQEQKYRQEGREALSKFRAILGTTDNWKLKKEDGKGMTLKIGNFEEYGVVYRLEGPIEAESSQVFKELVQNIENSHTWNKTVQKSMIIQRIDDSTDIVYNVASETPGGIVATRDFVSVRHWETKDGAYYSSGIGTTHNKVPPTELHVRGVNGPGGYYVEPIIGEPHRCILTFLINTDLKFQRKMPQYFMDQAMVGVMNDFYHCFTNHMLQHK